MDIQCNKSTRSASLSTSSVVRVTIISFFKKQQWSDCLSIFCVKTMTLCRIIVVHKTIICHETLWTVPKLSIMIIYNCTWSILIQQIRIILSTDNMTQKIQKKAYFLFVINFITRSKKICRLGRSLKNCGTIY